MAVVSAQGGSDGPRLITPFGAALGTSLASGGLGSPSKLGNRSRVQAVIRRKKIKLQRKNKNVSMHAHSSTLPAEQVHFPQRYYNGARNGQLAERSSL